MKFKISINMPKICIGTFILVGMIDLAVYEHNFDHTKEECKITKFLNSFDDGDFSLGTLHQWHAIERELPNNEDLIDTHVSYKCNTLNIHSEGEKTITIPLTRKAR